MTGTPIQNNLMELWSLVSWLGFETFAGKQNMREFKRQIEKPCKNGDARGFERLQVGDNAALSSNPDRDHNLDPAPGADGRRLSEAKQVGQEARRFSAGGSSQEDGHHPGRGAD